MLPRKEWLEELPPELCHSYATLPENLRSACARTPSDARTEGRLLRYLKTEPRTRLAAPRSPDLGWTSATRWAARRGPSWKRRRLGRGRGDGTSRGWVTCEGVSEDVLGEDEAVEGVEVEEEEEEEEMQEKTETRAGTGTATVWTRKRGRRWRRE